MPRRRESHRANGEGSITYDKSKRRYRVRVTLGDGSRRSALAATRVEAEAKLVELLGKAEAGALVTGESTTTVGSYLRWWVDEVLPTHELSSNTLDNYEWAVRVHIAPEIGSKRLGELTVENVEAMLRRMATAGASKSTIVRVRAVLVAGLRHAQRRERVGRNVAELAELPVGIAPPKERRSLTPTQAQAVLDAAGSHRLGALFTAQLLMGLRPGEVCGLMWGDVDLRKGNLRIERSLKREKGGRVLRLGEPKTKRSRATLAMPTLVADALRAHRGTRVRPADSLVFTTATGTPLDPSNLRREFRGFTLDVLGEGDWTPNELRHSFVSIAADAGLSLDDCVAVMRHTDSRMVERVYRHRVRPVIDAHVATIERLYSGAKA